MQPIPEKPISQTSLPTKEPGPIDFGDQLPFTIPPLILEAQEAFRRDLPQLLKERPGQWVAYSGEQRIGFGATQLGLYQECLRRGFKEDEFLVRSIEPEVYEIVLNLRPL
jgi:hypothetical protein